MHYSDVIWSDISTRIKLGADELTPWSIKIWPLHLLHTSMFYSGFWILKLQSQDYTTDQ
jgi:hypothetical protein